MSLYPDSTTGKIFSNTKTIKHERVIGMKFSPKLNRFVPTGTTIQRPYLQLVIKRASVPVTEVIPVAIPAPRWSWWHRMWLFFVRKLFNPSL